MRDTAGSTVRPAAALFALTLTVSSVLLGSTILNVALPTMQTELGASTTEQQWFLNAYTLTFAGFLLVAGNAGDRWGLKRLLVWGSAAFAVTTAVAGFLDSPLAIIVLRALMGVAAATIMPTTLAVILRIFPAGDRARAIATWAAASGLSISLGPLLGGALLSADMWWGSVLELVALFALLGLAATLAWIPAIPASGRGELRMTPVAGSLAGIGLLVFGVVHATDDGWAYPGTWLPAAAGVVVLAGLVLAEVRHREPLLDVGLFRHPSFTVAAVALTLGSFVVFGYLYFTTFYLQILRGYSPLRTGLLLIPLSAGLVAGAPLSRVATERFGARTTIATGIALMTAGCACITRLGGHTAAGWFVADAFVLQLGFALVLAPGTTLASSSVPAERAGAGSALLNTLRQLGSALGVAVLGSALWSRYSGAVLDRLTGSPAGVRRAAAESLASALATGDRTATEAAEAAFLGAMHVTALVAAGVCGVALLVTLCVRTSSRRGRTVAARTPEPQRAGADRGA
ncbi:MFS transporter [Streptomyces albus]|uniref:MFS transporter n=1 Tax=Streptomyces albus TaxID=1888 RepID=A0A8H1QQY6_9ACTN|nr:MULTISPECIES: MFS transporter [Streptomyces]EPD96105.1 drug:H+ antiporter-2 (14 Spanner) (DHA2) family drug resistance MFS transporter [Streptomyces sp. HPH0547]TGG78791.1 MFS transporter [Streptomyces albus]UVN57654.1 MFS transporter [Streptomyces albus]GHJ20148.1 MFS transporter [Streptomyces albus]